MASFVATPSGSLLEPRVRDSLKRTYSNGGSRHLYASPALYATPEQAPIPDCTSPGPIPPSPYVVNLKRRRGGDEAKRREDAAEVRDSPSGNDRGESSMETLVGDNFIDKSLDANDDDEFFDPRSEAMSVGSDSEANDLVAGTQLESRSLVSAQVDYFDANDDFSSDSSASNVPSSELHAVTLSIFDETERRKTTEETVVLMHSQWERICYLMSKAGLMFPPPPASDNTRLENDSIEQFSQEVLVTRFVSEAIARGQARAETEEAAAVIIESKDQELLRLRDRLQYYETVNNELSQRKLVEVASRQRQRRNQRRWIWSLLGLSFAIGASFVAYKYVPHATTRYISSPESGDSTDTSSVSRSDAS